MLFPLAALLPVAGWLGGQGLAWWIVSFVITAVTLPYSMILKLLAECGCVQHSRSTCLKRCLEGFGTCCLFIFAILGRSDRPSHTQPVPCQQPPAPPFGGLNRLLPSLLPGWLLCSGGVVAGVLYIALGVTLFIQVNGADKVSSWALSIGQSWCLWFVYWLPFFLLKFHRGRQAFQARFPQDCQAITPYTPDTAAAAVGAGPAISVVPMTPVINPAAAGAAFAFAPPVPSPAVLTVPGGGPVPPTIIVQPSRQPQQQSPPSGSGPGLLTLSSPKGRGAASSPPPPRGAASPVAASPLSPSPPPPLAPPPMVAAVQSPPMVRAMQVVIPPGAQPGMPLTVMTPEGLAVTIVVQPEHGPGAAIIVAY